MPQYLFQFFIFFILRRQYVNKKNGRMMSHNEFERIWKEVVVA
jgi:hypothetical protein